MKVRSVKLWLGAVLLAALGAWVGYVTLVHRGQRADRKSAIDAGRRHLQIRCENSGERLNQVITGVNGVVWPRWRVYGRTDDQFDRYDPFGRDCTGERCIAYLLKASLGMTLDPEEAARHARGYEFVETLDPRDNHMYRYRGVIKATRSRTDDEMREYERNAGKPAPREIYHFVLERERIDRFAARYEITWEDTSTDEDRRHWVAGSALRILDRTTGAIVAERVGYLFDPGLGSTAGFRSPWDWAKSSGPQCPKNVEFTWDFAMKVLQPIQ